MPVIEAQCASILVPHDHRHINQERKFRAALQNVARQIDPDGGLIGGGPGPLWTKRVRSPQPIGRLAPGHGQPAPCGRARNRVAVSGRPKIFCSPP